MYLLTYAYDVSLKVLSVYLVWKSQVSIGLGRYIRHPSGLCRVKVYSPRYPCFEMFVLSTQVIGLLNICEYFYLRGRVFLILSACSFFMSYTQNDESQKLLKDHEFLTKICTYLLVHTFLTQIRTYITSIDRPPVLFRKQTAANGHNFQN